MRIANTPFIIHMMLIPSLSCLQEIIVKYYFISIQEKGWLYIVRINLRFLYNYVKFCPCNEISNK